MFGTDVALDRVNDLEVTMRQIIRFILEWAEYILFFAFAVWLAYSFWAAYLGG